MRKFQIGLLVIFAALTFTAATAKCEANTPASTNLCNPTQDFAGSLGDAGKKLLNIFGLSIAWTSVAYLMFAGFKMIMSQGNEEEIAKAKSAFQWTLSGFVIALLAYVIIYATSTFIGADPPADGTNALCGLNPITSGTFGSLLQMMFRNFLTLAGLVSILLIIISGFRYITARGNEEQVSQAQKGLQWAVIGLIVILLSYVILIATAKLFGADITAENGGSTPDECNKTEVYPLQTQFVFNRN